MAFGITLPKISVPNPIQAVTTAVKAVTTTATTAATTAVKTVSAAAPTLQSVIKPIVPAVTAPVTVAQKVISTAPAVIAKPVTTAVQTATTTINKVVDTATKVVASAPAPVIAPLAAVIKAVVPNPATATPVATTIAQKATTAAASVAAAAAQVTGGYPTGVTEGKISGIVKFTSGWTGKYVLVDGFADYPGDAQQIEYADGTYSSNLRYSKSQNAVFAVGDWNIPKGVAYEDKRKVMTAPTSAKVGTDTIEILKVVPDTGAVLYRLNGSEVANSISDLKNTFGWAGALVDAWVAQHNADPKVGTSAATGWQASQGPVPSAADPFRLNIGTILNPVTGGAAALSGAIGAGIGGFLGGAGNAVDAAKDTAEHAVDTAAGILGGFGKTINNIVSLPTQVADKLVDGVVTTVDKAVAPITNGQSMATNLYRDIREMIAKMPKIFGVSILALFIGAAVLLILFAYGGKAKSKLSRRYY